MRSKLLHVLLLLVVGVLSLALLRKFCLQFRAVFNHTGYDGVDLRDRDERAAAIAAARIPTIP